MNKEFRIKNPKDFELVIKDILNWHKDKGKKNLVIALQGDLGAGKTALTKILGEYLGVSEIINSPTFVIMKQYELSHELFDLLVHIDAYRIEDESEIGPLRLSEIIKRPKTIVCIEWPDLIPSIIPDQAVKVNIEIEQGETRKVSVITPE